MESRDLEQNRKVIEASNRIYDEAARSFGATSRAVLADRPTRQISRFCELLRFVDVDSAKARLLEVGCGNGELYRYLAGVGYRGKYVGVDINQALLDQARQRFPGIDVRQADVVEADLGERFDVVLMSGVLNLDCGQDMAWVKRFVERMFMHCEGVLAFNALSTYVNFRDSKMFYIDPAEMFTFCVQTLSRRVTLAHHNLSYNYTVAVYREAEPLACPE